MSISFYNKQIIGLIACFCILFAAYGQRRQGHENIIRDSINLLQYKQSIIPLQRTNKTAELAQTYKRIADYCYQNAISDSMTIYYQLALREYEKTKDSFFIAYCYSRIGAVMAYKEKNPIVALQWLQPAASYFERAGEYIMAAHTTFDISLVHKAEGSGELMQQYLNKAIELNKLGKDTLLDIIILIKGADVLRKKEKWEAAHTKTLKALELSGLIKDRHFIDVCLVQLGQDYLYFGKPEKVISLFSESLKIKPGSGETITEIYSLLTISHIRLGNKKEAAKYFSLYSHTKDSIEQVANKNSYDELLIKYEAEKKQLTIESLEKENRLKERLSDNRGVFIMLLAAGLIFVLAAGFIFYHNFKKRQRLEKNLGQQENVFNLQLREEREKKLTAEFNKQLAEVQLTALNAQMNPHFIFNCMNSIQKYILKNEKTKALDFLQNFSDLMRNVLDNSSKTKISLDDEINMLEKYLLLEQLRLDNKFEYHIEVAADIQTDFFEIPGMIIQPYVENAIWHGLMNIEEDPNGGMKHKGVLRIIFSKEDAMIKCVVEDNGVGRNRAALLEKEQSPKRRSYGMAISKKRLELLKKENESLPEIKVEDLYSGDQPSGTRITINIHVD